jgi:hypothetical protein
MPQYVFSMYPMRYLVFGLLAALTHAATAQLRTIPEEAKRGQMSHLQDMVVAIDGKPARLSPGAQIRDPDNRLVLPVSLPGNSDVKYVVDESGMVHRVWILTAQEKAQTGQAKPKPPMEKKPEGMPLKK